MPGIKQIIPYRSVPIIFYHQIVETIDEENRILHSIPPDIFRSQMKYLHDRGYISISLDELESIDKNKKQDSRKLIAITFDDGYLDNYTNAFPILQEYEFSATIFAVTDLFGKSNVRNSCAPRRYLDWSHAKEMVRHGISFQSHTCTHPDLTKIGVKEGFYEIAVSRKKIEDALGTPVRHFSYPYGKYNDEVVEKVKKAGYLSSYAAGMSEKGGFVRERFEVELKDSSVLFSLMASHWGSWARRIRNSLFLPEFFSKK